MTAPMMFINSTMRSCYQVQMYIQQILEGVGHIHSMNILHLDIKVSSSYIHIHEAVCMFHLIVHAFLLVLCTLKQCTVVDSLMDSLVMT